MESSVGGGGGGGGGEPGHYVGVLLETIWSPVKSVRCCLCVWVGGWLRGRSVECNRKVENLGCSREAEICLSVGSAFGVVQVGCWCAWTLVCMYVGVLLRPYSLQSSQSLTQVCEREETQELC